MMINGAQLHLLFNHLPIIGTYFVCFTLIFAIVVNSVDIKRFALITSFLVGLSSLGAYYTGSPAAKISKTVVGVDKTLIGDHAELGEAATVLSIVMAVVALAAYLLQRKYPASLKKSIYLVLLICLVNAGLLGFVGHLGGKIHHPEIHMENPPQISIPSVDTTNDVQNQENENHSE